MLSTDGRALPLTSTSLAVDARGGVARVVVEQRFENPYNEPLSVTYSLPLPEEAAVSGFSFQVRGRRTVGRVDKKQIARARYEEALVQGRSAALLEQERSTLFTQQVGNIPPGEAIDVSVTIDQRLAWVADRATRERGVATNVESAKGSWEWRFPTVVAPRYVGAAGRVPDAARIEQDVAAEGLPARATLRCAIRDALSGSPESPSHRIAYGTRASGAIVELAEGAALDRDVVVRWPVASVEVGASLDVVRHDEDHAFGLVTIVPPAPDHAARPVARDLIVLLDTSGSMGGEPLDQARRVVAAILDTLRDGDRIELIEFSNEARRWRPGPVAATYPNRRAAMQWLASLQASGGTEMRTGIYEAMRALRQGAQRQIVLVTDGQIGFETEVIKTIVERLPEASRLHTVGVGSAVNRSLTGPAARAGRGVEVVIGLGEDPERAARRIAVRTADPVLVDLALDGDALIDHAPSKLPDLYAGLPALISVAIRPEGGVIVVRGSSADGAWETRLDVAPMLDDRSTEARGGNGGLATLFGREKVNDHELSLAAGGDRRALDRAIEEIGLRFQIATRLTSWIAVSREVTVDPNDPTRHERMPHELPHGMSAEGLGLRPTAAPAPMPGRAAPRSMSSTKAKSGTVVRRRVAPAAPEAEPEAELKRSGMVREVEPIELGRSGIVPEAEEDEASLGMTPAETLNAALRGAGSAPMPPASFAAPEKVASKGAAAAPLPPPSIGAPEPPSSFSAPEPLGMISPAAPMPAAPQQTIKVELADDAQKPGLFDRIKRFFTGGDKATRDEPVMAAVAEGSSIPFGALELAATIASLKDGVALVAITINDPLAWAPPNEVEVKLADGQTRTAKVLVEQSTKPCDAGRGVRVRLAIEVGEGVNESDVAMIVMMLAGRPVILTIGA